MPGLESIASWKREAVSGNLEALAQLEAES
jgi:hypothetical protein